MASPKEVRPPFAGLGGHTPEELFHRLPTPCYILDEAALRRNGQLECLRTFDYSDFKYRLGRPDV